MAVSDVSVIKPLTKSRVTYHNGGSTYVVAYDIVNQDTSEVLSGGQVIASMKTDRPKDRQKARDQCMAQIPGVLWRIRERHKARAALGGKSYAEVSPWLDNWGIFPLNLATYRFRLQHPVVAGQQQSVYFNEEDLENDWPTEKPLLDKLLTYYLEGPISCAASSPAAGVLDLSCDVVPGADGYRWYDQDNNELDRNTTPACSVSGLSAGTYTIRAAAAVGGIVGLLSVAVTVEVE